MTKREFENMIQPYQTGNVVFFENFEATIETIVEEESVTIRDTNGNLYKAKVWDLVSAPLTEYWMKRCDLQANGKPVDFEKGIRKEFNRCDLQIDSRYKIIISLEKFIVNWWQTGSSPELVVNVRLNSLPDLQNAYLFCLSKTLKIFPHPGK